MRQFGEELCMLCVSRMLYCVSPRVGRVTEFGPSLGRFWAGGGFGQGDGLLPIQGVKRDRCGR